MGRGRAKAKQTKVARDLKYYTPNTDLTALQRELSNAPAPVHRAVVEPEDDFDDPYADKYADEDEEEDDAAAASR